MEEGGSIQQQEICLSVGCYTFTITDSYGDGLVVLSLVVVLMGLLFQ